MHRTIIGLKNSHADSIHLQVEQLWRSSDRSVGVLPNEGYKATITDAVFTTTARIAQDLVLLYELRQYLSFSKNYSYDLFVVIGSDMRNQFLLQA